MSKIAGSPARFFDDLEKIDSKFSSRFDSSFSHLLARCYLMKVDLLGGSAQRTCWRGKRYGRAKTRPSVISVCSLIARPLLERGKNISQQRYAVKDFLQSAVILRRRLLVGEETSV
jgi:hypothetical protein